MSEKRAVGSRMGRVKLWGHNTGVRGEISVPRIIKVAIRSENECFTVYFTCTYMYIKPNPDVMPQ